MKKRRILAIMLAMSLAISSFYLTGCTDEEYVDDEYTEYEDEDTGKVTDAEEMNYDDLYVEVKNGDETVLLVPGMTEEEVIAELGQPTDIEDSRIDKSVFDGKGFIYGDYALYTYDGVALTFYDFDANDNDDTFKLYDVYVTSGEVNGPRDTAIGMTEDELLGSFANDGLNETLGYAEEDPESTWGTRIYGEDYKYNDITLAGKTGDYKIAYKTTPSEYDGTFYVTYAEYKAPSSNETITSTSESGELIYYMTEDGKVQAFRWSLNANLDM